MSHCSISVTGVATTSTGFAVLFRTKTGLRPGSSGKLPIYPGTEKEQLSNGTVSETPGVYTFLYLGASVRIFSFFIHLGAQKPFPSLCCSLFSSFHSLCGAYGFQSLATHKFLVNVVNIKSQRKLRHRSVSLR